MISKPALPWTIRKTLSWMGADFERHGITSARLDAELLVARALSCDRVALYVDMDRPLATDELELIRELVVRRRRREPVAYMVGRKEFYGRQFEVTPAVLIPRPDTEILVERALAIADVDGTRRALDLCTGSGAIAVTLAAERSSLLVDAADISSDALEVARGNAQKHGVADRVCFRQGDLFDALSGGIGSEFSAAGIADGYDMIVCNPPYISAEQWQDLAPDITDFEPEIALRAGADGLDFFRRICASVDGWLSRSGSLLLEVGHGQAGEVAEMLRAIPRFTLVTSHQDLAGLWRVVVAKSRKPL